MQLASKQRVRRGDRSRRKGLTPLWPESGGSGAEAPTLTIASRAGPWAVSDSQACRALMNRLSNDESHVAAMMMQEPGGGVVLGAAGVQEDNTVAANTVAEIQKRLRAPRTGRRKASIGGSFGERKRQSGAHITMVHQPQAPPQLSFGAVYEHRDSCGKPKLMGSTSLMPERQFAIDSSQSAETLQAVLQHGASAPEVVWAGVGSGLVGAAEMVEIRKAVLDSRSDRLKAQKLSSIKPYSNHT